MPNNFREIPDFSDRADSSGDKGKQSEGKVLVRRVRPGVLREELHPLGPKGREVRGARHCELDLGSLFVILASQGEDGGVQGDVLETSN